MQGQIKVLWNSHNLESDRTIVVKPTLKIVRWQYALSLFINHSGNFSFNQYKTNGFLTKS